MNKILFVLANPNEDLALTREFKAIAQADGLEQEARVLSRINPDWNELTKAIRNNSDISIFHFAGHAGSNRIELDDLGSVEPIFEKGLAGSNTGSK